MKNVLFICSSFPWPPNDGERVRTFNFIRELAKVVNLTVAHPGPEVLPDELVSALPGTVEWLPYKRREANLMLWAQSLLSLTPLFYKLARSTGLIRWMRSLPKSSFDVVHLDGLPAFNYYVDARAITENVVCDLRDSWSLLYSRLYDTGGRKPIQWIKGVLVARIERHVVERCAKVILISDVDEKHIIARYPKAKGNIQIIPNGVGEEFFQVRSRPLSGTLPTVAFTGAMDYQPNEQAVMFFVREIIPALERKQRAVTFRAIGKNPGAALRKLSCESVVVTGAVPSVATQLTEVDIAVAPLLSGAGMKNKVLEALAAGRPLVASKVAVEGIEITAGKHYLLAESSEQWADSIDWLAANPAEAISLAENGRAQVLANYSWCLAGRKVANLY